MVTRHIDPINVPAVTLRQDEVDYFNELIERGEVRRDFWDEYRRKVTAAVFGHDHKTDAKGNPIEQGVGSASNMTSQSVAAYERWCKDDPGYERNLMKMR